MGSSNSKPKENPNARRNIDVPHHQQPAGPHEARNIPSHEFDGAHNKSPASEGEDSGGYERRTPQGQRLTEHTVRDHEAKNSSVHRGEAARFAGRDYGPDKSPADRDERRRVYENDDESGKIAQQNDRFAHRHGGFPEEDGKSDQPAVQNQARVGNGGRFSKDDEQLIPRGRFHSDAAVVEEGKYHSYIYRYYQA